MSWKDLFVNGDVNTEAKNQQPKQEATTTTKFPTTTNSTPASNNIFGFSMSQTQPQTSTFTGGQVSTEHLEKALEIYQKGFDSLNQAGYDFYEFYQAVVHGGIDNPQIYSMAYAMGYGMDKTISKDKLLQQADFYLSEIRKVYSDNVAKGNSKKESLLAQKSSENQALSSELDLMRQQMEALKLQIQDRENKLSAIDGKYSPMISDVESKLSANEAANAQIVQTIQQVKNGIFNNLK